MEFGASIFFTDYSITPAELGIALEERGLTRFGRPSTRISRCRARPRRPAAANSTSAITT